MFSEELRNLLLKVISSWQVLAVTVVLVAYVFLIQFVARSYHRRRVRQPSTPKIKVKKEPAKMVVPQESDDLGLEEEEVAVTENTEE